MATLEDELLVANECSSVVSGAGDDTIEEPDHHDKSARAEPEEDAGEAVSVEMISLSVALRTRCFEGFESKRLTFLSTTQLTCSNVMSTVVTARPIDTAAKRRSRPSQPPSNQLEHASSSAALTANPEMHVYAQGCNPKKVKKKNGKYQVQLPSCRRSLPSLPVSVSRLNHELVEERDKFMRQLHQERQEKHKLDNWAATKIQACYRGFCGRPRLVTYEIRKKLNSLSSIRQDLSGMEDTLDQLTAAVSEGDEANGAPLASSWRNDIAARAGKKREFRAKKEHKNSAATVIQAIAKGFIARVAFAKRLAKHYDQISRAAAVKLQSMFRAYQLRAKISTVVAKLQGQSAVQIQSVVRGIQARERVLTLKFQRKCEQLQRDGLPLQFTLPQRPHEIVLTSCLRPLYEHHKTPSQLEFKTPLWYEDRMLLQIYKVAIKLNVQRQWLLRFVVTPPAKKQKRKTAPPRQPSSRLQTSQPSATSQQLLSEISSSTSPTTSRRRRRSQLAGGASLPEPTSSQPGSPTSNSRSLKAP